MTGFTGDCEPRRRKDCTSLMLVLLTRSGLLLRAAKAGGS